MTRAGEAALASELAFRAKAKAEAPAADVEVEEFNPNDAVSAARDAGRPDPSDVALEALAATRRRAADRLANGATFETLTPAERAAVQGEAPTLTVTPAAAAVIDTLAADLDARRAAVDDARAEEFADLRADALARSASTTRERLDLVAAVRRIVAESPTMATAVRTAIQEGLDDADRARRVAATDAGIAAADRAFRRSARVED